MLLYYEYANFNDSEEKAMQNQRERERERDRKRERGGRDPCVKCIIKTKDWKRLMWGKQDHWSE